MNDYLEIVSKLLNYLESIPFGEMTGTQKDLYRVLLTEYRNIPIQTEDAV